MQAAKIKIGDDYAVRIDGDLAIMQATQVVTTRTGSHPSDFDHVITGRVRINGKNEMRNYKPDMVLGPYTEYAELVAAKQKAHEEVLAATKAREALSHDVVRMLYRLCEMPVPNDLTHYNNPFYARSSEITIRTDAHAKLRDVLRARLMDDDLKIALKK